MMSLFETSEGVFVVLSLISIMAMFFSWLLFARLSMARIERDMERDGLNRPCPWDGVGGRAVWYAFAIGLPMGPWNPGNDPLVDVPLLRQYAKPIDRKLGLALVVSGGVTVLLGLSGALVFDFY